MDTQVTDRAAMTRTLDYKGKVVLVLQGGGALGAYQVGVIEALTRAGIEPDWVVGTSIGAINAALVAGSPIAERTERIDAFWDRVSFDLTAGTLAGPFGQMARQWMNAMTVVRGVPGFFSPNPLSMLGDKAPLGPTKAAYYTTDALRQTMQDLVDFKRLNAPGGMRVSLGAVNVASGEMTYFDNRDANGDGIRDTGPLDARHVLASGALPPAFPAVEIDGQFYWDGGLYSNTPIEVVMDDRPRQDCLIFAVNLWHSAGVAPASIASALARMKDIQFASRANHNIDSEGKMHRLRHVVRELGLALPEDIKARPEIAELLSWGCRTVMQVVRFNAPRTTFEDQSKDIDFSSEGIAERRAAGYEDGCRALEAQDWTKPHPALDGIVVHDA